MKGKSSTKFYITDAIREVLPAGEFTSEDVIDELWTHPELQDMTESKLCKAIQVRLLHLMKLGEIEVVRREPTKHGHVNIYAHTGKKDNQIALFS